MPDIRQLPPSAVNKIAAGEVIERPSSIVKELVENSIDAGATQIDVSIEEGGTATVRVRDNGHGIAADQLVLAVASHATSKIRDADELFQVSTLGFRGEALASIAEVSHFHIISRATDATAGAELEITGGVLAPVAPTGSAPGTTIEIRNLFFNTPVRRKFLRRAQTEMSHCTEAFTRLALAHPQIHFTLRNQKRMLHDLPPTESLRDRIATFYGEELAEALLWVESGEDEIHLSGYVARPDHSRSHARMQYLFLNGRHIRDRALQHALAEAYRGLLLHGRHPITFLRLDMPAEMVDVNVHPTKLEVRFQDSGRVYSQLLGTLRSRFLSTDLGSVIRPAGSNDSDDPQTPSGAADAGAADNVRQQFVDWAKGQLGEAASPSSEAPSFRYDDRQGASLRLRQLDRSWQAAGGAEPARALPASTTPLPDADHQVAAEGPTTASDSHRRSLALQIHDRYIVTQCDEGVIVIDQHALHERILYEELRATVDAGKLETQRLLVPEPVDLSPAEAAAVTQATSVLSELGIEVEPFGGDTVLITSYPAMLANLAPAELLRQVVELLLSGGEGPQMRDLLDELLHMMSCKAAIKAGDRLSPEEVDALLTRRHLCQDSHHCPHGRPTSLVFTREELDRRFKRI